MIVNIKEDTTFVINRHKVDQYSYVNFYLMIQNGGDRESSVFNLNLPV